MIRLRSLVPFGCLAVLLGFVLSAGGVSASDQKLKIAIVTGDSAPQLERFAAKELADQLRKLFQAEVVVGSKLATAEHIILLGSPTTNPAVREAAGNRWPALSDQGHLLRTAKHHDRPALIVGGGSPLATLWATYELAQRFGMRSLLQGDFLPVDGRSFTVDGFDTVLEPEVKVRAWQTLDGGPIGWEAWGLADQQRILRQLAKRKLNRLVLSLPTSWLELPVGRGAGDQPDRPRSSGWSFPVDGDTAGRKAFGGARLFENPDFSGRESPAERSAARIALVRGMIRSAQELGFTVAVQFAPLESAADATAKANEADEARRRQSLAEWHRRLQDPAGGQRDGNRAPALQLGGPDPAIMPVTLCATGLGVLPQVRLTALESLAAQLKGAKSDGWVIHGFTPSDAELGFYYLSRAAFEPRLTPKETTAELITTIAGEGVAERLLIGFDMVEQAVAKIEQHAPDFAAVAPSMVIRHGEPADPIPVWWTEARELYTKAMDEMYRGNTRAREGGRDFILYFARRYEFGMTYLTSLEALRQASLARAKKDPESQTQQLEAAVEGMYNALNAFSEVSRDPSDRGVIAVLNEFGYRPLQRELQSVGAP